MFGNRVAIRDQSGSYSYRDLLDRSKELAEFNYRS